MQEDLRKRVKILKALQGVQYSELAAYLEIQKKRINKWLKGYYNLSAEREKRLFEIINLISE